MVSSPGSDSIGQAVGFDPSRIAADNIQSFDLHHQFFGFFAESFRQLCGSVGQSISNPAAESDHIHDFPDLLFLTPGKAQTLQVIGMDKPLFLTFHYPADHLSGRNGIHPRLVQVSIHLQGKRKIAISQPGGEAAESLEFRTFCLAILDHVIPRAVDVAVKTGFILHFPGASQHLSGNLIHICADTLLKMPGRKDADIIEVFHQHGGSHLVPLLVFVVT